MAVRFAGTFDGERDEKILILTGLRVLGGRLPQVVMTPASPYHAIPPGSVIRPEQRIVIPAGKAQIRIQGGKIAGTGFNAFDPSCNLEVARLDEANSRYVEPGEFRVTRARFLREAIATAGHLMVAANGPLLAEAPDNGGDEFFHE